MEKLIRTPVPLSTSQEEITQANKFLSLIGLRLSFNDETGIWEMTGFPKFNLVRGAALEFEAGYDFEKWLQKQDILLPRDEHEWYEFDSEYSQVWIYFGDADYAYSIIRTLERKIDQIIDLLTF